MRATVPLHRGRLRNGHDQEGVHAARRVVHLFLHKARVHDIAHAVDRERCGSNVLRVCVSGHAGQLHECHVSVHARPRALLPGHASRWLVCPYGCNDDFAHGGRRGVKDVTLQLRLEGAVERHDLHASHVGIADLAVVERGRGFVQATAQVVDVGTACAQARETVSVRDRG